MSDGNKMLPTERYLVDHLSSAISDSLLDKMGMRKTPKQVLMIETEAWGENLTLPVPPEAKGKRVRIRMELIE
jgi:hypothetical protein